jgi:TraM recognition site of TraD and TraG
MGLLLSLRGQETVVFQHAVTRTSAVDNGSKYAFSLLVRSTPQSHDDLVQRVTSELQQASPCLSLSYAASNAATSNQEMAAQQCSNLWQIRLAPTVLKMRPVVSGFATADVFSEINLPFPAELPSSSLGCLLRTSQATDNNCRLSIRVGAFSLTEAECEAHLRLKRLLDAGMLAAYHPDSPFQKDFAANSALLEKTSALLDAWLRHPDYGFGTDCIVESSSSLSPLQLQAIAQDVFGKRPVRITSVDADIFASPPTFTFVDTVKPGQGLPSVLPDASKLSAFGVAEHFNPPPKKPPSSGGVVIGTSVCGVTSGPVALPSEDRFSHMGIFGASGSGKSTFLLNLLAQDLADPTQPGIGLIDPHGTLYADVLRLIPSRRRDDVVLVDVTDPSFVSSINPLAGMAQDRQYGNFIANEIVALISVLFEGKDTSGPTIRNHVKNALLLGSYIPGRASSFLDASRLFEDKDFRDYLLSKCNDAKIHNYWRDFTATNGEHGFSNWLPWIQSRLSPFCDSPLMRRMLNAPQSRIDIDKCVANGKIILFNLSAAVLGSQEARIFGNLMLNRIFYAAMRRKKRGPEKANPFHLVVDEAASMVSASTMRLWAEAGKFGLSLTTANQSISQLRSRNGDTEIAQSLLANTATKVFFRLSPSDASLLEPYASPEFSAKELTRLPVFHSALSMSAHGQILPAFVCKVQRPTVDPAKHALPSSVIEASRAAFSAPIAAIVTELAAIYELPEDCFCTANDDPTTKRQPDLFAKAGVPLLVQKSAAFERFASLMDDALGFVMGSRWTLNAGDIQDKVRLTKYFDPNAEQPPSFKAVYDLVEADTALSLPTRFLVIIALDTMRQHFWRDTEDMSTGAET